MRKLLAFLIACLAFSGIARAQISGVGQLGCSGAPVTGTAWNSSTANNTTQQLLTNAAAAAVLVELDQTTTITGGAVTFQQSGDGSGGTYFTIPVAQVINPSTGAQLTNPYTLVASTNQQFLIILPAGSNLQLKLTTVIAGTGSVTPFVTTLCNNPTLPIFLDAAGNILVKVNVALPTGANVIGGVTQSGTWNVTVNTALPTGANTIGAVTQASGPWTMNVTQIAGTSLGATAVTNFGTAPAAAAVEGVNANIFNAGAAITASAPLAAQLSQGNAVLSASNPIFNAITDGTNGLVAVKPAINPTTVPPTFTTAGATGANQALTITLSPNSGIPAIVQKASGTGSGSQASLATSNFGSAVTAGNSIVVVVGVGNNGAIGVTDTLGNSFTQALVQTNGTTFEVAIFYATNVKGGTDAVTVTPSASVSLDIAAYEVTGIIGVGGGGSTTTTPSTVNQQSSTDASASSSGSSAAPASGNGTILFPNEIAFGGIAIGTANSTPSAFTPWNKDFSLAVGGSPSGLFGLHTFSQPMGGDSAVVSLTATITSDPWATAIVTFRSATTAIAGRVTALGTKTNNNAAPGATNFGALPAIANAATQSWTEGNLVALSVDLSGQQRIRGILSDNGAAAASNRIPAVSAIYQTDYRNGTAGTQGNDAAQEVGTDGLLWVANLPAMRPASYHTSSNFAASSTTDNFVFPGNATNTVLITKVTVSCTQTTAGIVLMKVIKRSTADTSGTSAAITPVPDDSNYAAASSAPLSYTGTGPTVGTAVGTVDEYYLGCLAAGTTTANDIYILNLRQKPIVLRGTAQQLAINFNNTALTGGTINVTVDHIETKTITP